MPFGLLWILLLVPAKVQAQSGDREMDHELRMSCTSQISVYASNSLTCNLVGNNGNEDDEDDESEEIEMMSVRFLKSRTNKVQVLKRKGNSITSNRLNVLRKYNLTVQLKGGGIFNKQIDLKSIVKPKSPQIWNATFHQRSKRTVIYIWTPYQSDYLTGKQLFQLDISNAKHSLIHNVTLMLLTIEGEHLRMNTDYHVKVRAIPFDVPAHYFRGFWSDWSAPCNFSTHTKDRAGAAEEGSQVLLLYVSTVSLVAVLLVMWSVAFFLRKKIHACMWPSIPHPKLTQIYKPIKGPPVSFDPEAFSDPHVHPVHRVEDQPCAEAEPLDGGDITEDPCFAREFSGETSDSGCCGSEESASTLLTSGSSMGGGEEEGGEKGEGEWEYHQAGRGGPSPVGVLLELGEGPDAYRPGDPEVYGDNQQGRDEDYVTMSSFYQIKN